MKNNEIKIAYLFGSLNRGGAETLFLDTFKNSDFAKFDFIGIHRKGGDLKEDFYQTNKRMYRLSPRGFWDFSYFYKLRTLLRKEKVKIVHAQQYLDAFYAWIACAGTGIKIIQTFHGYDNLSSKKEKLLLFIAKHTDKNIFVSNFQKKYYLGKYKLDEKKQIVVYNGISFKKINATSTVVSPVIPDIKQEELLLGSVGNFVSGRDQLTICKFLNLLNQEGVEFRFVFVGAKSASKSALYDECVEYCNNLGLKDKVYFLGSRNDVPDILRQLDAFIYSSDHDTFGIAVVEAIASGIPVFVNDWEVMTEITQNGKFAVLYKTKDEYDLLSKFKLYLKNKEQYKEGALIASQSVQDLYSIKNFIDKLNEVYTNVLS